MARSIYRSGTDRLHDPTGRVYPAVANGRLDCLTTPASAPTAWVLDPTETVLFVAMTRARGLALAFS